MSVQFVGEKVKKIILSGYIQVPKNDLEAVKFVLPEHIAATREEPGMEKAVCIVDAWLGAAFKDGRHQRH